MTDRLAELTAGTGISLDDELVEVDINEVEDPEADEETRESLAKFRRETEALSKAIDRVHENVETIESRYQISMNDYVDDGDKEIASNDIGRLLEQTEKTSGAIRKRLRRIAGENNAFAREFKSKTGELRVRVNTHQGLTRRFMDAMQLFEESQEKHRNNVKTALERQLRLMNPQATEDDILDALRLGKTDSIVDDSPTLAQLPPEEQMQLRRGLDDLRSRNNDMKKLEESIIQLHQLFVDMQTLVEAQGDLLSDIEYNIEDTKGKTEVGYQELVEARSHQKSANKKKLCFILLLIVVILAIAVPLLVKFIPKWFPETADTINNLPIIGSGANSTETPPEADAPTAKLDEVDRPLHVSALTVNVLKPTDTVVRSAHESTLAVGHVRPVDASTLAVVDVRPVDASTLGAVDVRPVKTSATVGEGGRPMGASAVAAEGGEHADAPTLSKRAVKLADASALSRQVGRPVDASTAAGQVLQLSSETIES